MARLASINHHFLVTDTLDKHPYKIQPGNINFEFMYAVPAIVNYLASLGQAGGAAQPAYAVARHPKPRSLRATRRALTKCTRRSRARPPPPPPPLLAMAPAAGPSR